MARTSQPNSAGSQFFIVLDDSVADSLPKSGGYVIFGNVTSGMDVVDQIALTPNSVIASGNQALDPTVHEHGDHPAGHELDSGACRQPVEHSLQRLHRRLRAPLLRWLQALS